MTSSAFEQVRWKITTSLTSLWFKYMYLRIYSGQPITPPYRKTTAHETAGLSLKMERFKVMLPLRAGVNSWPSQPCCNVIVVSHFIRRWTINLINYSKTLSQSTHQSGWMLASASTCHGGRSSWPSAIAYRSCDILKRQIYSGYGKCIGFWDFRFRAELDPKFSTFAQTSSRLLYLVPSMCSQNDYNLSEAVELYD